MGENICQSSDWKGINCQNIKHLWQLNTKKQTNKQTNKQPHQKMGRPFKQTVLQRRHADGQKTHEKMFSVTHYERNANPNYHDVSPYTGQNGHHQNI